MTPNFLKYLSMFINKVCVHNATTIKKRFALDELVKNKDIRGSNWLMHYYFWDFNANLSPLDKLSYCFLKAVDAISHLVSSR